MANIPGTKVLAPIVPLDTNNEYPTHDAKYGKGGFRNVANAAERAGLLGIQLPLLRRSPGMIVYQEDTGDYYKLENDLSTWTNLGPTLGGGSTTPNALIANENISALRMVTIDNTGKAVYASSDDLNHIARFIALSLSAGVINDSIQILESGLHEDLSWNWNVGLPIFLGLNGTLTQTIPVYPTNLFRKIIGYAKSSTTIYIDTQESIQLT